MSANDLHHERLLYRLKLTTHHDLVVVALSHDELEAVLLVHRHQVDQFISDSVLIQKKVPESYM